MPELSCSSAAAKSAYNFFEVNQEIAKKTEIF
jgi:hypothetical protein